MLGTVFDRCVEKSPISVMVRGTLERGVGAAQLDAWLPRTAPKQYTRTVLFSTLYAMLRQVVLRIRSSVRAAYRDQADTVGASRISVYNKRTGGETQTSAELGRDSATPVRPWLPPLHGARVAWLPGSRVPRLDGHWLAASERRRKVLREGQAGALPGPSLVVYEPRDGRRSAVCPCDDGHAQARALWEQVVGTGRPHDLWIPDRHGCPCALLCALDSRAARVITRHHAGLPFEAVTAGRPAGRRETGPVAEQQGPVRDAQGQGHRWRRIQVPRAQAPRDGERVRYLLTKLPRDTASAIRGARVYRQRWPLAPAFPHLEADCQAELNTLGSPHAALWGLCLALVADTRGAVGPAAVRSVHDATTLDQALSL